MTKLSPKVIRILLVEDSPTVAFHIKGLLALSKESVFEVEHTPDLQSSLEKIADESIDVVLLDLGLPDSYGLDTFVKMHERAPDAAVVVFTGVDDEEVAFEALRQGAQDYLVKGHVDSPILIRAIRYAIERKQAEVSLRESEEQHRTLLEAMPDIVYKIDAEGYFKYVNPAVTGLGYQPEELIGEHFSTIVHPKDLASVSRGSVLPPLQGLYTGMDSAPKLLDERRTGVRMTRDLTLRLIPKNWNEENDNDLFFGSLTSYGEVTAVGHYALNKRTMVKQFAGTVGIIKDISKRMQSEQEKASLEAQLRQSQKMEAIGRLAGGVAHDMNNVLGAVMGSASALETEMQKDHPHYADVSNILSACRKGRDLTRDLLGFARKGKYVKETFSVNDVAEEARSLLERTIPKTIKVVCELSEHLRMVEGDRSQIHHALMNVCINAADAMGSVGLLKITSQNTVMAQVLPKGGASGLPAGEYVEIAVTDTGTGMDEETLQKAFEPFFTTKPKGEGTGLGLSMVYGVMKNHGGKVTIESEKGVGTTVTFLLPAIHSLRLRPMEPPQNKVSTTPRSGSILLVDDEQIIRNAARRILKLRGYDVILAESGVKAIEIFKEKKETVSLVLLDIIMPEMDGIDTFEALVKIDPSVNVLLFSGYSKDDRVERLLSKGRVRFAHKPFDIASLSKSVKECLANPSSPEETSFEE
jgi:PAS domain S-box-containing protein